MNQKWSEEKLEIYNLMLLTLTPGQTYRLPDSLHTLLGWVHSTTLKEKA